MADKKISQLTALSAANVASATDVLAIVDTSATETKKITAKDLIDGALNGGTANGVLYLNGSKVATSGSALTFDGTNLGIGTSSPASTLEAYKSVDVASASNQDVLTLTTVDSAGGYYYAGLGSGIAFRSGKTSATVFNPVVMGAIYGANSSDESVANGYLSFHTRSSGTVDERGRFTAGGDLLVGKTASGFTNTGFEVTPAGGIMLTRNAGTNCVQINKKGNTGDLMAFYYNDASVVGTITNSSTNTAYNTSSDRRLKENIAPAADAGAVIDAIEVVQHDWKVGGHTRYGMIAQDLHKVAPEAVSAGDDGEEVERSWGVDYSKLVPMLVKEIQSLRSRVAALEAQ